MRNWLFEINGSIDIPDHIKTTEHLISYINSNLNNRELFNSFKIKITGSTNAWGNK